MEIVHNRNKYKYELLDLLSRVGKVLESEGIEYFGVYGTCLGAIREKGIIPWDDDIDIAVRRGDFKKALDVLHNSEYQIYAGDRETIVGCPSRCGRIFNRIDSNSNIEQKRAYLDLHIIDYAPVSSLRFYWSVLWYVALTRIVSSRNGRTESARHRLLYRVADIIGLPFRLCSTTFLTSLSDWFYVYKKKSSLVKITFDGNRKRYPASLFLCAIKKPVEGIMLPVPNGYEKYLEICYGNWKSPPPVQDRYSHAYDRSGLVWTVPMPSENERRKLFD